jgi:hypothetical protein
MKPKLGFLILIVFFLSESSYSQVDLDTVFVTKKRENAAFMMIRYYYYPNLQAYFDTETTLYIYKSNGEWITSERIPANFRGYSLKNSNYVMIKGYLGDEPYTLLEKHKKDFPADFSSKRRPKDIEVMK